MKLLQLSTEPRNSIPTPIAARNREPCKAGHVYRVGRCLGFWLGGVMLGAVGYVVGAFLSYPPVGVVCLSIAYGCIGLKAAGRYGVRCAFFQGEFPCY